MADNSYRHIIYIYTHKIYKYIYVLHGKIVNKWTDGRKDGWTIIMIMNLNIMSDIQVIDVNQ